MKTKTNVKRKIKVEHIVLYLLENQRETRNDDYKLILTFLEKFIKEQKLDLTIKELFIKHKEINLPSLETITRCRRRLQEKYAHLCNSDAVARRMEEEKVFKEYSRC